VPRKIELESILGVEVPLGEPDLEPDGVCVEENKEETEGFEAWYGRVATEEAIV
jgi:hypothetical protein